MKQETLEEVASEFAKDHYKMYETSNLGSMHFGFYWGAKWQQERSYTEEEVISLLIKREYALDSYDMANDYKDAVKWFEQFKNK